MTRKTNSRIAGVTFLVYIAAGLTSLAISGRAVSGEGIAAKLAGYAEHATDVRVAFIFSLLSVFCALVLAVTLHAITRDEDNDLAMLGMVFRVGEGVGGALPVSLSLLWLATATGVDAPDTATAHALGRFLQKVGGWQTLTAATLFAVGSTCFCWLLLRGRMIPVPLAWLGVLASVLLVVTLPLQLAGFFSGRFFDLIWIPMALFEIVLALWLIIKGAAPPFKRAPAGEIAVA
jgi:hypothetical protein